MATTAALEAQTVYLFQCNNDPALFAVSPERNAGNIPPSAAWYGGWRLRGELPLGREGPALADIDPKQIMRGVRSVGYYIWRNDLA